MGFSSMNCAVSQRFLALSSIRITPVGLARSCPAGTPGSLSVYCHSGIPSLLNRWDLPLRRDRDFDGVVDELQLQGFQALCAPSGSVVSQRLVCHSCCFKSCICWVSAGVHCVLVMQKPVTTCVEDETVYSSVASPVENLISFLT